MLKTCDVVIVGAGPAGLSLACSPKSKGLSILLVEAGKPLEERDSSLPLDVGKGVAGAGAYIDGKLSFFPAGTALWRADYDLLVSSYNSFRSLLLNFSNDIPPMPTKLEIDSYFFQPELAWKLKRYKSIYMDEKQRFKFLIHLIALAKQNAVLQTNTRMIGWQKVKQGYLVTTKNADGIEEEILCKSLVLAGGRFMPLQRLSPSDLQIFRRIEIGIRIELPHDNEAILQLGSQGTLDPKMILESDHKIQYRTFCFCRRGTVVESEIDSIRTFSGRADVEPTERTNFGLMVRLLNPTQDEENLTSLLQKPWTLVLSEAPLEKDQLDWIHEQLIEKMGPTFGNLVFEAFQQLSTKYPCLLTYKLKLYGPCLEGVGHYMDINENFESLHFPYIYAIGDNSGTIRGLVPSMLSGYYVANHLSNNLKAQVKLSEASTIIAQPDLSLPSLEVV